MTFTFSESLSLVKRNTGNTDEILISKWLEDAKAVNGAYRPYFVIAVFLWLKTDNNLVKAEGAEFDQNRETTKRFLKIQKRIDLQENLQIPEQYSCDILLRDVNGENGDSTGFIGF